MIIDTTREPTTASSRRSSHRALNVAVSKEHGGLGQARADLLGLADQLLRPPFPAFILQRSRPAQHARPFTCLVPTTAAAPSIQTLLERGDCDAFVLNAAMNPCPCGYYGDPRRACSCATGAIGRYQRYMMGTDMDAGRFDRLAAAWATRRSRRGALALLGSRALAGGLGLTQPEPAEARCRHASNCTKLRFPTCQMEVSSRVRLIVRRSHVPADHAAPNRSLWTISASGFRA